MANQEKEMGLADLENFLKQQFPQSNKVNTLLEQITKSKAEMEKEIGEENPFFYGAVSRYMSSHSSRGIDDWVDSKGNVNIAQINTVVTIAKKEFEQKKMQERQSIPNDKDNLESTDVKDIKENQFVSRLKNIDFNNMTVDDIIDIASNSEEFIKNSTKEQFKQYNEKMYNIFGIAKEYQYLIEFMKDPESMTPERQDYIERNLPPEEYNILYDEDGKIKPSEIRSLYDKQQSVIQTVLILYQQKGKDITLEDVNNALDDSQKEFITKFPKRLNIEKCVELANTGKLEEKLNEINDKSTMDDIVEQPQKVDEDGTIIVEQEDFLGFDTYRTDNSEEFEEFFDNMFAGIKDPAEAMEMDLGEEQVEQTLEDLPEDQPQPELADEEVQNEAMEEVQDENIEEIEEEIQEEAKEEIPEEQYEAPTFEEEKKGLAGLFSRIANSRAVKAVTNLFKPKEEQKRLNAPANQRVEDGVRFTDYVSKGSLPKNIIRDIAVSTVEAVTDFAKSISGRNKKEDETILNRPIVIQTDKTKQSEKVVVQDKAQTEKTVTQEQQQTVEKTETFNDTNKWAVSKEAIQRQDAINKAQERNNLSHVATPKQEELQSEEDKSFEEI